MLNLIIFLPLATGALVLALPSSRPSWIRMTAFAGSLITLVLALVLWTIGFDPSSPGLKWRSTVDWIPSIGASYDVAVNGFSLALILLTHVLLCAVMIYVMPNRDRPKAHAFLFLLMATGLTGVFAARDLLLFYLFFEVALVPLYFIVGLWGHANRRYAAIKFFLYTRAGSLAMLLSFLGLYLAAEPHTFSLDELIAAQPLADRPVAAGWALIGLLLGFGVKLPVVPLHNWLPDAHVEAPVEGSVMLAGIQLKMGAYGMIAVMFPLLPEALRHYGGLLVGLGIFSLIYGALAALAQKDFKRLIAYTSINHMGYIMVGVAVAALAVEPGVTSLALNGASLQAVSHGLLTGGMFFMVGILRDKTGTRDMDRLRGLLRRAPRYCFLLGVLAFASLGLPGFSGFLAEFQVIGAVLSVSVTAAAFVLLGLILMTAVYIRIIVDVVMGEPSKDVKEAEDLETREAISVLPLAFLSLLIGIVPAVIGPVLRTFG